MYFSSPSYVSQQRGCVCAAGPGHICGGPLGGISQSMEEMEFEKSICGAAARGQETLVKQMIARGASANTIDQHGYTALHYAAARGSVPIVKFLLESRANPNIQTKGLQSTPLHSASTQGHIQIVELLLQAQADPSIQDADGMTPLHKAASNSKDPVVKRLVQHSPQLLRIPNNKGQTPAQLQISQQIADFFASVNL